MNTATISQPSSFSVLVPLYHIQCNDWSSFQTLSFVFCCILNFDISIPATSMTSLRFTSDQNQNQSQKPQLMSWKNALYILGFCAPQTHHFRFPFTGLFSSHFLLTPPPTHAIHFLASYEPPGPPSSANRRTIDGPISSYSERTLSVKCLRCRKQVTYQLLCGSNFWIQGFGRADFLRTMDRAVVACARWPALPIHRFVHHRS